GDLRQAGLVGDGDRRLRRAGVVGGDVGDRVRVVDDHGRVFGLLGGVPRAVVRRDAVVERLVDDLEAAGRPAVHLEGVLDGSSRVATDLLGRAGHRPRRVEVDRALARIRAVLDARNAEVFRRQAGGRAARATIGLGGGVLR